jgi:hypothetical protein
MHEKNNFFKKLEYLEKVVLHLNEENFHDRLIMTILVLQNKKNKKKMLNG